MVDDRIEIGSGDAGEPSGTAGKPILSTIEGRNLLNVGVVVTRYFGGTKLGTGGLARAYADCANITIDAAEILSQIVSANITIRFPYDYMNGVMRIVERIGGRVTNSVYEQDATLKVTIPRSESDRFQHEVMEACRGNVKFLD